MMGCEGWVRVGAEWLLGGVLLVLGAGVMLPLRLRVSDFVVVRGLLLTGCLGTLVCALCVYLQGPVHGLWLWGMLSWSIDLLTMWFLVVLSVTVGVLSVLRSLRQAQSPSILPYTTALCGCMLAALLLMTMNHILSVVISWGMMGMFWRFLNHTERGSNQQLHRLHLLVRGDHIGTFMLLVALLLCVAAAHSGEFADLVRAPLTGERKFAFILCVLLVIGFRCLWMPLLLAKHNQLTDHGSEGLAMLTITGLYMAYRCVLDFLTPGPLELGLLVVAVAVAYGLVWQVVVIRWHVFMTVGGQLALVALLWSLVCLGLIMVYWIQGLTALCTLTFVSGLASLLFFMLASVLCTMVRTVGLARQRAWVPWSGLGLLPVAPLVSGFVVWFLSFQSVFYLFWTLSYPTGLWVTLMMVVAMGWAWILIFGKMLRWERGTLSVGSRWRWSGWCVAVLLMLGILWPRWLFMVFEPLITSYTMLDAAHFYQLTDCSIRFSVPPLDTHLFLPGLAVVFVLLLGICGWGAILLGTRFRMVHGEIRWEHAVALAAAGSLCVLVGYGVWATAEGWDIFVVFLLLGLTQASRWLTTGTGNKWNALLSKEMAWLFCLTVVGIQYKTSDLHAVALFISRRMFLQWPDLVLINSLFFLLVAEWIDFARAHSMRRLVAGIRLFSLLMLVTYLFWHPGDIVDGIQAWIPLIVVAGLCVLIIVINQGLNRVRRLYRDCLPSNCWRVELTISVGLAMGLAVMSQFSLFFADHV